jgi:hypothetical protein
MEPVGGIVVSALVRKASPTVSQARSRVIGGAWRPLQHDSNLYVNGKVW